MKTNSAADASLKRFVRRIEAELLKVYGEPNVKPSRTLLDELVWTVLSQNTTDVNSTRAFMSLRTRFKRWEDVLAAPTPEVAAAIRCAGLANTKAPRIQAILKRMKEERGRLSLTHVAEMAEAAATEYLLSLPGVGPKTAACVLLFGTGKDVFPVDTHIHRLCRRLGIVSHFTSAEKTQEQMIGIVPKGRSLALHVNLIRHGRKVCRAQKPKCKECTLVRLCPSSPGPDRLTA